MSNRRDFLRNISLVTAGGLLAGKSGVMHAATNESSAAMANKSLGLQIYSLQNELYDDLPKRMKELKMLGYENLELAGYSSGKIGEVDMMEFKRIAEGEGLKLVSSHVNTLINGKYEFFGKYALDMLPQIKEFWKTVADDHAKLGCKYIIQPMQPGCDTHEEAAVICEIFNAIGEVTKASGIPFGYHNHNFEFKRLVKPEDKRPPSPFDIFMPQGDQILDLFIKGTDPSLVFFELDVYWTVMGQNDPVEYMAKNASRIKALHIKDRSVLGRSGMMNFEMIFKQMYDNGIKDFFVELEAMPDGHSQFAGVTDSAAYLQKAPFVR